MFKKLLALTIAALLISLLQVAPVTATTKPEDEAKFAEEVKTEVARLGTGPEARIEVRLRNKTKLKGYVSEADDTHFAVVDERTGTATTVAYPQVQKVKGSNLSSGARIAIGIAVIVGILSLVVRAGL
jgi:hypothetical protein